jgi:hypothetical protein
MLAQIPVMFIPKSNRRATVCLSVCSSLRKMPRHDNDLPQFQEALGTHNRKFVDREENNGEMIIIG